MLASIGVDASEHGGGGHIGYHIFSEALLPAAPQTFQWLRGPLVVFMSKVVLVLVMELVESS